MKKSAGADPDQVARDGVRAPGREPDAGRVRVAAGAPPGMGPPRDARRPPAGTGWRPPDRDPATVLEWGITLDGGRVVEGNFDGYPLLRIGDAPDIEVHLLDSDRPPAGAGEPPYPSVAPAVANAVRAAGGPRIRRLPVSAGHHP